MRHVPILDSANGLWQLAWRPTERSTTEKVRVEMGHRLASSLALVNHQSVTIFEAFALRDGFCGIQDVLMVARVWKTRQTRDLRAWDDHDMGRCLRRYVSEGDNMLVFIDDVRWNLAIDDLGEQRRHVSIMVVCCP